MVWFLISLLRLSQGPAAAEWVAVETTLSGITTVYVEPDSIRRRERMVRMWHVIDFKTVQDYLGYAVLSVRAQSHYDCTDECTRTFPSCFSTSPTSRPAEQLSAWVSLRMTANVGDLIPRSIWLT